MGSGPVLRCGNREPRMAEMGQKPRFRAAQRPCVIVRSTPVSRPSKGGPAWLLSATTRREQVQHYSITSSARAKRGCGRHVCLIAPRRIGLGLRAEPPLGPSIQQHNSRRARSRPWPLQPTHRNDTKHDLPRRITRNARGSARYGGRPRGNRHRGSMSRILGRIGPEGRSSRRI